MKYNFDIDKKVKATIDSVESIEEVKVSPFLKDKILYNIGVEKAEAISLWSWFTPSLQLATLVLFMILNVYAYKSLSSEDYNATVEEFVDTYDFGEEATYTSIFN